MWGGPQDASTGAFIEKKHYFPPTICNVHLNVIMMIIVSPLTISLCHPS
jgi:hypothetical protein